MMQKIWKNLWKINILPALVLAVFLAGCSSSHRASNDSLHRKLSKEDPRNIEYKGHYKVGAPYKMDNVSYVPKKVIIYSKVGIASWYGSKGGFHGKKTANGDIYNKYALTAANRDLPLPSLTKVTNLKNKKSIIVMINDRGPRSKKRIIDVSEKTAEILGFKKQGLTKVRVEYLPKETEEFLKKISLPAKHGAKVRKKTQMTENKYCSINCHVKLINMKHKLSLTPDLN